MGQNWEMEQFVFGEKGGTGEGLRDDDTGGQLQYRPAIAFLLQLSQNLGGQVLDQDKHTYR